MKLKEKELIIFPTDTVYGLGAKINDLEALQKIYQIKNRDISKRLIYLFENTKQIEQICEVDARIQAVMDHYFPGALTLILWKKGKEETQGVRIPNHAIALSLLRENGPLATTSVNRSSEPPYHDIVKIREVFGSEVEHIVEHDQNILQQSSTIVDMTQEPIACLREGPILFEDILKVYYQS